MGLPAALWTRPASALSVGQQQRVAAARALIGKPELVIAAEIDLDAMPAATATLATRQRATLPPRLLRAYFASPP